ncbi:etoposide-induced protein 2.4-domain-containing protein [Hysterangium stoloniferum]|nr:etoposide-induced protein 2.4-domain-containing protein [Hysterangium stoloniferum]
MSHNASRSVNQIRNGDLRSHTTSRSSYPTFISLPETLRLHLGFLLHGLMDAFRWDFTVKSISADAEIRSHVLKSFTLNGLSLISIYVFEYILLPLATGSRSQPYIGWLYRVLWVFPLVATSLYLNGTWAGVVAKRSYSLQHGPRSTVPPSSYTGILTAMASSAYRVAMVVTSIVLTTTLSYIPFVGPLFGFAFLCWINAYYCFEFTWVARGMTLSQRVRYLEERWAYYFAFGLPSASLCAFMPSLGGAALFALLLPFYIIKATNAQPVPKDPYSPISPSRQPDGGHAVYPSPFFPIRIPVFTLVIAIDNFVVRSLSVASPPRSRNQAGVRGTMQRQHLLGDPDVAASAEEGAYYSKRKTARKWD